MKHAQRMKKAMALILAIMIGLSALSGIVITFM